MKRIFRNILTILLVTTAASSCRALVFEDRRDCPAFVFFDVIDDKGVGSYEKAHIEIHETEGMTLLGQDVVTLEKMAGDDYYIPVHKSPEILATGLVGIVSSENNGSAWIVPSGYQGDRLYWFSDKAEASGEMTHIPVCLRKEHSVITVRFKAENNVFPYTINVKANTQGIDMISGEPISGPFRFTPLESEPGIFQFVVPRQSDLSLTLELYAKPGTSAETGKVDSIVLWAALQKIIGFNWNVENLPDLTVDIDYVRSQMTVYVNDWKVGTTIDYTI